MSSEGRRWFEQRKDFVAVPAEVAVVETPDLWTRCPGCSEAVYNESLVENLQVCPLCGHHLSIEAEVRLRSLCDETPFSLHDLDLSSVDALRFVDSKPYHRRIEETRRKTGLNDAYVAATAAIDGVEVEIGAFEFRYLGGSMGSVVGEAITRQVERAIAARRPVVIISSSGGARMQEGVLSLMQMAKTSAALARLKDEARMPYISVLTHPTTGGVAASFAMLGDVILAEPASLVGFAGPRVIKETIGEALPEGFQTAEYLLEHGMVDRIVSRLELRGVLARLLRQLLSLPASVEPIGLGGR
jgi:acetyl-CoA carboxylase carboxyl transferase subunit beta